MLRGRHRGLPVAIDRAVLLPSEYKQYDDCDDCDDGAGDSDNGRPISEAHNRQQIPQRMDSYSFLVEKSSEDITEIRRESQSNL